MAEGRMLKKVISTSQKLAHLKSDAARLLYTWLLAHLDIEGRFSANASVVKGYVVPRLKMSSKKIDEYLKDMAINDLIVLYEVSGDKFLQYKKFKDFQTLRKGREKDSIIPPPVKKTRVIPSEPTEDRRICAAQDKIREDKIREDNTSCSEKTSEHAFKYSPIHKDLAKMLEMKIKDRIPRHKFQGKDYLEQWANEFRIMEEKKEATSEEIEVIIIWVSKHDFWYKNVKSADKLRKQFGRLWAEMQEDKEGKPISRQPTKKERHMKEVRKKFLARDNYDKQD